MQSMEPPGRLAGGFSDNPAYRRSGGQQAERVGTVVDMTNEGPAFTEDEYRQLAEQHLRLGGRTPTIAERRRYRLGDRVTSELNRLNWERQEIAEEYRMASEIYARKLERLGARARRNAEAMKALADRTTAEVDRLLVR